MSEKTRKQDRRTRYTRPVSYTHLDVYKRQIEGCAHAVSFYSAVTKYFVPDNLRTAVTKHTKDGCFLVLIMTEMLSA